MAGLDPVVLVADPEPFDSPELLAAPLLAEEVSEEPFVAASFAEEPVSEDSFAEESPEEAPSEVVAVDPRASLR